MKWSIKYIVSALPFLFTACSGDWLDLDPSTSVTSDNSYCIALFNLASCHFV